MKHSTRSHVTRILAAALVAALAISAAPAMASVLGDARLAGTTVTFSAPMTPVEAPVEPGERLAAPKTGTATYTAPRTPLTRVQAPVRRPAPAPATGSAPAQNAASGGSARAAAAASLVQNSAAPRPPAQVSDRLAEARAILARYAATYQYVSGTTVEFGDTRGNPQAIVYYKSKRIIINPNHTVSLERIIAHEIWHIIDWHHNGAINWGENTPPSNANDFRL